MRSHRCWGLLKSGSRMKAVHAVVPGHGWAVPTSRRSRRCDYTPFQFMLPTRLWRYGTDKNSDVRTFPNNTQPTPMPTLRVQRRSDRSPSSTH